MRGVIPALIQDDPAFSESPSLVLIHDGGGTTINYYFLDDLGRHVWGISNEVLVGENAWPGGINQLARTYVELIRSELPRGPLILGGWSFGGLIALEMAKVLTEDAECLVLGVVMIDTLYPSTNGIVAMDDNAAIEWGEATTEESKEITLTSIANCSLFAQKWAQGSTKGRDTPTELPPMILLRADDSHRGAASEVKEARRKSRLLGWENYRNDFVSQVLDVPGNHYNLFSDDNVDELTDTLSKACTILEKAASH